MLYLEYYCRVLDYPQFDAHFRRAQTLTSHSWTWHNFIRLSETIADLNEWSDFVKAGKLILLM